MPSATGEPGAARADPSPVSDLRLPTGKVALLLLGLCRQGQALEPIDDRGDGRLWFRWQGLRGVGEAAVGILADDEEALEALRRAPGAVRSYVELLAVLSCVHSLANADGQWRLERIASLLYGPRTPSSHRARQLPGIRGWLALLERGYFQLAVPADKGSRPATDVIAGQLLTMERSASGHARTVRPLPDLLAALGSFTVLVPGAYFALADDGHHNPEGNLPGLPMKARLRLAAAVAARWRRNQPQAMRTDELLRDFAGVDCERVQRRRHVPQWTEELWRVLKRAKEIGPGLARVERSESDRGDDVERSLLRTFLRSAGRVIEQTGPARYGQQRWPGPQRRRSRAPV